ncbi:MAG: PQQ-dependent sugar dehydrogenase [Nitrososphaera sp.]|uniref:PQQ-dependent sugar dehydrogenase n=1 Tax=Nitrososphaera sp. TaxID=1971748 RepID=UPI003D6DE566
MDRDRRLALIAAAAVAVAAIATYFFTPSSTIVPIPEPTAIRNNNTGTSAGIEVIADNLEVPWAVDVAGDGRVFFTERAGRIGIVEGGKVLEPVFIKVEQNEEAGLMGLALHPDFTNNHLLYVYHTYSNGTGVYNKVVALTERDNKIVGSKAVIEGIPAADRNDGGRIKFGPDGKLYVATGDARQPDLAQDTASLAGKVLRLNDDGTVPGDNPFPGSPVYSYGHRNIQGLAWHPQTGELYASEHGESGNDEINLIKAGRNYGWPAEECNAERFEKPVYCFNPVIAPAGMTFAASDALGYRGDILLSALKAKQLRHVDLETGNTVNVLTGFGRIRDVVEAPDGSLYVLTSNRDGRAIPGQDDDKILRLLPTGDGNP